MVFLLALHQARNTWLVLQVDVSPLVRCWLSPQVSMLGARVLLSRCLGSGGGLSTENVAGPFTPPQALEPSTDQLALEHAFKMQQQENQVEPQQKRVADAEGKLASQQEQLWCTAHSNLDMEIAYVLFFHGL